MARAALSWTTADLAAKAEVGTNTINRFEAGQDARISSVEKMQRALEAAGVIFVAENGEGPGVRLRKGVVPSHRISTSAEQIEASGASARGRAANAADKAMEGMDASHGQKADRRDALTEEPAMVEKARRTSRKKG